MRFGDNHDIRMKCFCVPIVWVTCSTDFVSGAIQRDVGEFVRSVKHVIHYCVHGIRVVRFLGNVQTGRMTVLLYVFVKTCFGRRIWDIHIFCTFKSRDGCIVSSCLYVYTNAYYWYDEIL